jgi:hypothetical protein
MSWTASSRTFASLLLIGTLPACVTSRGAPEFSRVLKDFRHWQVEAERPVARTFLRHGVLDIDSAGGITLWLTHEMHGPVEIEFEATALDARGPNDNVSDLNVFWMATNVDGSAPYLRRRSGKFAEYNDMLAYYVGLGGNRNTTTRFRRYIGDPQVRPLLPQHDLSAPEALLVPNRRQKITLIADGEHIEYRRDGKRLFAYEDAAPYTRGWFGLRTTDSHLRIENLRVRNGRAD